MKKHQKRNRKQIADYDLMEDLEDLEYYQREAEDAENASRRQRRLLALALLLLMVVAILFSPLFLVKEIRAEGNTHFTTSELSEKIGLSVGEHLLLFSKTKAKSILEEDAYIEKAKLSIELPGTMVIHVEERKVRGYVPYMGAYLYIDDAGRVLDVQDACHEALPLVRGLVFDSFTKGEVIPVQNPESLDGVLRISQLMEKYELLDLVVEIDVSNPEDIYAYVNQVQIHLGNMKNGDTKIRYMAEVMKKIPAEDRGTLDLSELDKSGGSVVFRYLT